MDFHTIKLNGSHKPTSIPKNAKPITKGRAISNTNILHSTNSTNRDVSNFTSLSKFQLGVINKDSRMKRKGSAEIEQEQNRFISKAPLLRRSRSAEDLYSTSRNLTLKRIMEGKENYDIPSKMLKVLPTGTKTLSHHMSIPATSGSKSGFSLKRIDNKKRTVSSTGGAISKMVTSSSIREMKPNSSKLSAKSQSATVTAPKPTGKKIPAYDYKARFNDLVEKHKILKTKFDNAQEDLGNYETMSDQYEECQNELIKTKEEMRNVTMQLECLQKQNQSQDIKITSLTNCLKKTNEEYEKLKKEFAELLPKYTETEKINIELKEENEELSVNVQYLVSELEECKDLLFKSNTERKELHNAVMDLRGNIRVFCRVRPSLSTEEGRSLCTWNYIDESTVEILNADLLTNGAKNKNASHTFSFDHVFHQRSTQEDVFELVSPLLQSALDGYNVCIFAYGQTGSGKTYTMDGDSVNFGVVPRTVDLLFESIKNYKRLGWEYEIKVSFLEIYNEVLYDLLSNEQKDMEIRISPKNKNDIYVSNLSEETVTDAARLRQLMQIAKMNRATAATVGNERSSRSHAVTKIELIGIHEEKNEISIGKINLVDLAGSESPKTSVRMNETKNINRSLSELTNVILALTQKQDHIPYRNSKLTHLLMPSLGGNSKTLMFINVAPFQDCFVESVKSLRFASSVNSCKVAKAKKNKFLNTSNSNLYSN